MTSDDASRLADDIRETLGVAETVVVYFGAHQLALRDAWTDADRPALLIGKGANGEDVTIVAEEIVGFRTAD